MKYKDIIRKDAAKIPGGGITQFPEVAEENTGNEF